MDFLFGKRKTPAELMRQHQRALQRAQREMDRERSKLEQQEKKLIIDIKNTAKKGQMGACKVMAMDLVRTRRYIQKFYQMRTQLQAVSLRIQTLRSNQAMAEAMKGVTKAMKTMNKQINLPQIQKIMMDFEQESEILDMKDEMMNVPETHDTMEDAMGEEDEEEESDAIVNQVLDEIGISLDDQMATAPSGMLSTGNSATAAKTLAAEPIAMGAAGEDDDDDLMKRLDNLRK
ncbi:MAG: hypothetical protein SGCHY_004831 [Lobulomycetales sp.]